VGGYRVALTHTKSCISALYYSVYLQKKRYKTKKTCCTINFLLSNNAFHLLFTSGKYEEPVPPVYAELNKPLKKEEIEGKPSSNDIYLFFILVS